MIGTTAETKELQYLNEFISAHPTVKERLAAGKALRNTLPRRAHAKSGDAAMIAGYCGKGDALPEAIGAFADRYAEQNAADHDRLMAAIRAGRIRATLNL